MSKILCCAECGYQIHLGEEYYEVKDNFLRAKYFDSDEDVRFCSPNCVLEAISCELETYDGSFGEEEYA